MALPASQRPARHPSSRPEPRSLRPGARFFADVTAATGTDVVNRVWKDATLQPAAGEFTDANAWIGRVADVERKRGLDHA
ncbi:zinc-dependent metalloprotease [Streptomyces phaeochromogenes]|uniref:zinc-dependent metalloprotease n=1 Tax=Streptomyces phaeochromogenes TaxID=1923 RepID=UPI0036C72586